MTANSKRLVRQVSQQDLVFHRRDCRHNKRGEPINHHELILAARRIAAGDIWVEHDARVLRLHLCGTCKPWKAPARPWPPA